MQEIVQFPCGKCGADLFYNFKSDVLNCDYCGYQEKFADDTEKATKTSYDKFLQTFTKPSIDLAENVLEVNCKDCGASVIFAPADASKCCAFCNSPIVVQPKSADHIVAPQGIHRFLISAEEAQKTVYDWAENLLVLPGELHRNFALEKLNGVYLPFWKFEAGSQTIYQLYGHTQFHTKGGVFGTEDKLVQLLEGDNDPDSQLGYGEHAEIFEDVRVPATSSTHAVLFDKTEARKFDPKNLKPYDPAYLSGYSAQRYQIDPLDAFEQAEESMRAEIDKILANFRKHDPRIRSHKAKTAFSEISFQHLLLPYYLSGFKHDGKVYQVLVNGETGKLEGEYPTVFWKVLMYKGLSWLSWSIFFFAIYIMGACVVNGKLNTNYLIIFGLSIPGIIILYRIARFLAKRL